MSEEVMTLRHMLDGVDELFLVKIARSINCICLRSSGVIWSVE